MAKFSVNVKSTADEFAKIQKALQFIADTAVYVGIPQSDTMREDDNEVTNAQLLFIHSNGSPAKNIPPRPVIEPAIKKDRDRLAKMMEKAAHCAFDGNVDKSLQQLKLTGMRGQDVSRAWFYDPENGWQPDKPSTIKAKKAKHKNVKGYDPRTLIDTSQLKNSITYFVKTKGGRTK